MFNDRFSDHRSPRPVHVLVAMYQHHDVVSDIQPELHLVGSVHQMDLKTSLIHAM